LPELSASSAISAALSNVPRAASVLVRDVGQASFSSLCDEKGCAILHYDVGFPISFNRHTFPRDFDINAAEKPPIILSHWDWDHFHGAFHLPHLLDCVWIVPDQRLGPGAARLARILAAKGNLLVRPKRARKRFVFGDLALSTGLANDLNDTGLSVLVNLVNGRSVLLTGDADYTHLGYSKALVVDHLVATHHGARFDALPGLVPASKSKEGELVISCGTRNVYRHPHPEALLKHKRAGWKKQTTTAGRKGHAQRANRTLK
jgi:competence protein ComEC